MVGVHYFFLVEGEGGGVSHRACALRCMVELVGTAKLKVLEKKLSKMATVKMTHVVCSMRLLLFDDVDNIHSSRGHSSILRKEYLVGLGTLFWFVVVVTTLHFFSLLGDNIEFD